ncbi:hypothetical protein F2P79_022396 [Pimephales promelas]|nr:hypothetical protein F2P79_022396 [Pimephales promelas]
MSEEWMNGEVSSESQNNLRKKIYKHRDSLAHKRAVEILEMKEKDVLPNKVVEDIVELSEGTDAESMYKSLRKSLRQAGLDNEFLGKNLICIATDGAAEPATSLNMQILKIGQIFTIRWVASSFRTVKAVWNDYPALAHQFRTAMEDTSRCDTERQKFRGLHKLLTSTGFLADLACMKDVVVSLKLQRKQTSLVDASCHIQQTIDVLTAMKASGGKSTQKAEQRISTGLFKDVELSESRPKINHLQFNQSIINSLKEHSDFFGTIHLTPRVR